MNTTTSTTAAPVHPSSIAPGGGERLWIAGDVVHLKATAAQTGGAFTVLEIESAPGNGPPPHIHERENEVFYVLDGAFEFLLGDRLVRGEAGTFVFVPHGTVHRFRNTGDRPGRILVHFTPGGLDGFFREAGTPATHDGPAPPIDDAEIARTTAAGERYGLRVVDWTANPATPPPH